MPPAARYPSDDGRVGDLSEVGGRLDAATKALGRVRLALIGATDVVLMGWLGPHPLAASALGLNLNFALSLVCLGLVTASPSRS